ncbi:hypothetical protein [Acinetobacter rathckeae]|nr:hypothetical protein [Acinetobacter rathckeae]
MKAAVVKKDHGVDIQDKKLRPLQYGEALLSMELRGMPYRLTR